MGIKEDRPKERASGGVGTAAITLGRAIGGPEANIIAVCSGKNEKLVKDLGANSVIDYTKETPLGSLGKQLLKKDGMLIALNGSLYRFTQLLTGTESKNQKILLSDQKGDDLREILKILKEQKVEPILDKVLEFNAKNIKEAISDLQSR